MQMIRSAAIAAILAVSLGQTAAAASVRVPMADRSVGEVYSALVKTAHKVCKDQAISNVHDRADVARCVLDTVEDAVARTQSVALNKQHQNRRDTAVLLAAR
jgi:hypothetical protein